MKTINHKEIEKFSRMAEEWWDPKGKFKPLHKFNPSRIQYIKTGVINHFKITSFKTPFSNLSLLDIGCGGGLLSEPMSRLGANVTAIDASKKNIEIAKLHLKKSELKINYINTSPEKLNDKKRYDIILNMEIVEHVSDLEYFIKCCSNLLKKNGIMFIATLNKTLKSYVFAIVGAEYVLRWLPIGTHDWEKFLTPNKLKIITTKYNFSSDEVVGMKFNLISKKWNTSSDASVNYISTFLRN